ASSKPVYPVTPTTATWRGSLISLFADEGFDFLLQGFASFSMRRDDQDCIVAGNCACDFSKFRSVHGSGQGRPTAGRRLQHEKIFGRSYVQQELRQGPGQRR